MPRIRQIDLLRCVAAGLVLLSHVGFWTGASKLDTVGPLLARGDSGVAVFFALSAFLLLRPWYAARIDGGPRPRVRAYAVRRAARILPAYWPALAAVVLVAALFPYATGGIGSFGTVLSHVLLLQGYTGADYQAFTQSWSLTTEVTFYALVPLLGIALLGRSREAGASRPLDVRRHLALLGAVAVAGVALQGAAAAWSGPGALTVSVLGHAAWFAAGAAGALTVTLRRSGAWPAPAPGTAATLVLAAGVVYLLAATPLAGPVGLQAPTAVEAATKEALYTALAGLLVLASVSAADSAWSRSAVVGWLGDISYGVFLWHLLALQVVYLVTDRELFTGGFWLVLVPVVGLTVAAASLSAQLLEQPILRAAHRATRSSRPSPSSPAPRPRA